MKLFNNFLIRTIQNFFVFILEKIGSKPLLFIFDVGDRFLVPYYGQPMYCLTETGYNSHKITPGDRKYDTLNPFTFPNLKTYFDISGNGYIHVYIYTYVRTYIER